MDIVAGMVGGRRHWGWRLLIGLLLATVGVAAAWPYLADRKPWILVAIGCAATLLTTFGPTLLERLQVRLTDVDDHARATRTYRTDAPASVPLHAASAVVTFRGREAELARLGSWCGQDDAGPVRLLIGGGGFGKTRLARELARRLRSRGRLAWRRWRVWEIPSGSERQAAEAVADPQRAQRLLITVDYAETRSPADLAALVTAVALSDRGRVRLLLIARHDGLWWRYLSRYSTGHTAVVENLTAQPSNVIALPARPEGHSAREILATAAADFARHLDMPAPRQLPAIRKGDVSLLHLHARALASVLGSGGHENALTEILQHEQRYWHARARRGNPPLLSLGDPEREPYIDETLRKMVGVAALLGVTARREDAEGIITRTTPTGVAASDRPRWAAWLVDLYPAAAGTPIDSFTTLQPDLLAEHLAAEVVTGCRPEDLSVMFVGLTDAQARHALTVLGRAAVAHPQVNARIATILTSGLTMLAAAIDVSRQFPRLYPAHVIDALPTMTLSVAQLAQLADQIPERSVELAPMAVALTQALVDQPLTDPGDHVLWHFEHATRLAAVGRYQDAAAYSWRLANAALGLLAEGHENMLPAVAHTLHQHMRIYGNAMHYTQSLRFSHATVIAFRTLADSAPAEYLPLLADSLSIHAGLLGMAGRHQEALKDSREALNINHSLHDTSKQGRIARTEMLARHGLLLSLAGHRLKAPAYTKKAVTLFRDLAATNPDAYLPELSVHLTNYAVHLAGAGHAGDALRISEEAVAVARRLDKMNHQVYAPTLAGALNNHAARLSEADRHLEAITFSQQSISLRRALVAQDRDAHLPGLGKSLNNHAIWLAHLGRYTEALTTSEEAVGIRRQLAATNPVAYKPDLRDSLTNHANLLHELGHHDQARAPTDEATSLQQELTAMSVPPIPAGLDPHQPESQETNETIM